MNIIKEQLAELNSKIEQSNEEFLQASPAKKRMILAQDVLDRIDIGQLKPDRLGSTVQMVTKNHYTDGGYDDVYLAYYSNKDVSIKESLQNPTVQCQVCAKGGMFLSLIGRVNEFTWRDFSPFTNHNLPPQQKLLEIFSERMLAAIEAAFEGGTHVDVDLLGRLLWVETDHFEFNRYYCNYDNSNDRLKAICENIIQNEGSFVIGNCTYN
jgi:hypothetical protein